MTAPHRSDRPFNDPADRIENYSVILTPNGPHERDRARLKLGEQAADADDLRELLGALGLGQADEIRSQLRRRREDRQTTTPIGENR
jgi:hypothetical protein